MLINHGKTNYIYLSIIFVVAVLVGGLIWQISNLNEMNNEEPQNIALPKNINFDGYTNEWKAVQPSLKDIKYYQESRDGNVWVGQIEDGIIIAGNILGDKPLWSANKADLKSGDHIEIWVSSADSLELPPIGWGNQFGYEYSSIAVEGEYKFSENQKVLEWTKEQEEYRKVFKKLFVRKWEINPNFIVENFASPAFDSFNGDTQGKLSLLGISDVLPQIKIQNNPSSDIAYSFEFLIPWESLPPMENLELGSIKVLVNAFKPDAYKTANGPIQQNDWEYEDINPFTIVKIAEPRNYFITPCDYSLSDIIVDTGPNTGGLVSSEFAKIYYIPTQDLDIRKFIVIDNEAAGYQYDPYSSSKSPIALPANFFTKKIDDQSLICGPKLTYKKGDLIVKTNYWIEPEETEFRKLSSGDFIVKDGPEYFYSYYGSGQCGGCERIGLAMYYIENVSGKINRAFQWEDMNEADSHYVSVELSESWDIINIFTTPPNYGEYNSVGKEWLSKHYCFSEKDKEYKRCGGSCISNEPLKLTDPNNPPECSWTRPLEACLAGDTKVLMADGSYKNIKEIIEGSLVKSFDIGKNAYKDAEVIKVIKREDPIVTINDILKAAPDEPIYLADGTVKAAVELKVGETLFNDKKVNSIDYSADLVDTYDLILEDADNFFAEGYLVRIPNF